ncbi:MAG: hypothetical protein MJE77_30405 [Proteobacteria bacterium]|nr:hypothetical protein [Pseudomonadota bacterium]
MDRDDNPRLGFSLGIGHSAVSLVLAEQTLFHWLQVDRLELEIPGADSTNFLSSAEVVPEPEEFQRRRTRVRTARLHVDQSGVERYISDQLSGLERLKVSNLDIQLADGYVSIAAQVYETKTACDMTFRLYVGICPGGVRVQVGEAQIYGFTTVPAPLLAHRIAAVLLHATDTTGSNGDRRANRSAVLWATGLGQFEIDPLQSLLWHTLPGSGWRLPKVAGVKLTGVRITRGAIQIVYEPPGPGQHKFKGDSVSTAVLDQLLGAARDLRQGDDALLAGDTERALAAYRGELAASGPDKLLLAERMLAVLATRPALFVEAGELARKVLERHADFAPAHTALANIAAAQGHVRAAASHYQRVVALVNDDAAAIRAALAGARFLRTTQPEAATQLYERIVERVPNHAEASAALVERYTAEERFADLVQLIRTRASLETDPGRKSTDHLRLAELLKTHLGDVDAARSEIEEACHSDPTNIAALEAKVDASLATGDRQTALEILDRIARLLAESGDAHSQAGVLVRMAEICQRLDHIPRAAERYEQALVVEPDNSAALAGAASLAARQDDHRGAVKLWHRLLESAELSPRDAARHQIELGVSLAAMADSTAAREVLRQAAYHSTGEVAARAHVLLADLLHGTRDLTGVADELDAAVVALTRAAENFFARAPESEPGQGARAGAPDQVGGEGVSAGKQYLDQAAKYSLERAGLLEELGREDESRDDYHRAHSLARDVAPEHARTAARSLLEAERRRGDLAGQRRWIDALLVAQPKSDERVELLLSRAQLRADDPDDTDGALHDIDDILAEQTSGAKRALALGLQARLLSSLGDHQGRARSLADRAVLVEDPAERAAAEADAAAAWLDADDVENAFHAATRAAEALVEADRDDDAASPELRRQVLGLLGDAAWRQRAWPDVVLGYESLASGQLGDALPADRRATCRYRLGTALHRVGDDQRALAVFDDLLAEEQLVGELRQAVWRGLADIHERAGNHLVAARAHESLAGDDAVGAGRDSRAESLFRAGELYRQAGGDDADTAVEHCLHAVLEIVQDHMPALDALEKLEQSRGDSEAVAVVLSRKIAATARQPKRQKSLLVRMARLQHEQLDRIDVARESYQRALDIDPDYRPALRFVAPDYFDEGDFERAADAYERLARELPDDGEEAETSKELLDERIDAAAALADVALRAGLGSESGKELATRSYATIDALLQIAPHDRKLLAKRGALDSSIREQSHVADSSADASEAARQSADTARTKAEVLALRQGVQAALARGDRASAARSLDRAVGLHPGDIAVLRACVDLAREMDDHAASARFLEKLALQLSAKDEDGGLQRARLAVVYLELADIYYDRLGDRARARKAMWEAAAAHGSGSRREVVLRMLAGEAATDGADGEAAEAYENISSNRRTAADFVHLATCYERLERQNDALTTLRAAQTFGMLSEEASQMLARLEKTLATKRARANELVATAHGPFAESRLREALHLYEKVLHDQVNAARVRARLAKKETTTTMKGGIATLKPRAKRGTQPLGRIQPVRSKRETQIGQPVPSSRKSQYGPTKKNRRPTTVGAHNLHSSPVKLVPEPERKAVEPKVAQPHPGERTTAGDRTGGRVEGSAPPSSAPHSPPDRALKNATLGPASRAGGKASQRSQYRSGSAPGREPGAVGQVPGRIPDISGDSGPIESLEGPAGSVTAAARQDDREERVDRKPGRPANLPLVPETLRIVSELQERGDVDAALLQCRAAAAAHPKDPRPLQVLLRLLDKRGETDAIDRVLDQLIALTTADSRARAQLWFRRAKLHRDVLHSESETYRYLREAFACDPNDREIAYALRSVAMARGEWVLAAELIEREIAQAATSREAGALHLELGMVYDEKLVEPELAQSHYEQALALDPEIPAAPAPLARLYETAGRHADAARMNVQAAQHLPVGGARARLLVRAAGLVERTGDVDEARRLYQHAVVAAVDEPAVRSMAQTAIARLSVQDSTSSLDMRLRDTTDEGEQMVILRQLLNQAKERKDEAASTRYARALLSLDPGDLTAYTVLKNQAEKAGNWKTLARLVHSRASVLSEPSQQAAAYYELGQLRQENLDDERGAMIAYESALAANPGHPEALEALSDLAYQRRDWERAQELHTHLKPDTCSLSADSIAYRRGVIAEALGRQRDAVRAFSEAVDLVPSNRPALQAKARAALRIGDVKTALEASRALLDLIPSDDIQAVSHARLDLAKLYARAGNRHKAIEYNELVLAENPRSETALRALVKLYSGVGKHAEAASVLRELIALTGALAKRAEMLYRLGEIYRVHLHDNDQAADCYLKGIDLNPRHVPTLRRLVDYYWREDDPGELLDMANSLAEQDVLLHERTGTDTLIRALVTAASRADTNLARKIFDWLGRERLEKRLVAILAEATQRKNLRTSVETLAIAVRAICEELPALSTEVIANRLELAASGDTLRQLVAALRAPV